MAMTDYQPPTQLDIIYEDEHLLAVNKPSGLLSVPGRLAEHYDSAWSRLQAQFPKVHVVHRLDMSTSGLMIFAKNKRAESALKKQFQYRLTHKIYYAQIWGCPTQTQGCIALPLRCDWENRPMQMVCHEHGKPAKTYYQVVEQKEKTAIVRLIPVTGRSHQLRVHMQALGHPIVGDEFYSSDEAFHFSKRLDLHASELSFYHPKSQWLRRLFIECDFYQAAEPMTFEHFNPERKLPDYSTLNIEI